MRSRNMALTWFGVILTFVGTFAVFYSTPAPLPLRFRSIMGRMAANAS